ncbi:Bug family tripartite tricarboxylate transporter substrate binding protein [Halomonas sp. C05BenzN]|uniref:Bug family tripartite tricarboxylate transporter substrate binding protein n=1 Tax=Halomonas sp. C05BenzN TaxID=3411041 RepID=UPI003B95A11C
MINKRFRARFTTPMMAAACLLAVPPAMAQDDFYAGKTLQVVVPFGEGGATYVAAKFLEPFFEKHLPGNPRVDVQTRPGGGSILGANWFEQNAEPDGETLLFTTSSTSNPYVLGLDAVEYDLASMRPAYSLPFGAGIYVSPSTGIESAADLRDAGTPLIYGGIAAAASDLPVLLAFELLELDLRTVLGFDGRGPARLAFERGETNIDFQFTPAYMSQVVDMVEAGTAVPIMSGGSVGEDGVLSARDPAFPDYPSVHEVYAELNGEAPSGVVWDAYQSIGSVTFNYGLTAYLPEGTPDEVLEVFEATIQAINEDPEYQRRAAEAVGGYSLLPASEITDSLAAALQPSDEVRDYLRDLLSDKYDVAL